MTKIRKALRPAANPGATSQTGTAAAAPAPRPPHPAPTEHRTFRLFYALKVPQDVAAPLAQAQRQLRGNWRPVHPDQFHITLAYLPAVPPEKVGS
ncbi:MAG: 2'-5' RNA ligase family protein, partial [Deinococcota bacterium]